MNDLVIFKSKIFNKKCKIIRIKNMEKYEEEKTLKIQKIKTKLIVNKTKLSNCINKNYIYILLLFNSIIASISSYKIRITISGSGNIRIIDINERKPNEYCINNNYNVSNCPIFESNNINIYLFLKLNI